MLTPQEARQVLTAHAREIVRLRKSDGTLVHRRFLDADALDVSDIAWMDAESDDTSLSMSWWYLYVFLDAARQGLRDLDGIPWPEAVALVEEIAERLAKGQPIDKALILRYAP